MDNWREKALDAGLLWLRIAVGIGLIVHGSAKFGKMDKFVGYLTKLDVPMPLISAWAATLAEFVGGIHLAIGLGTRFAGAAVAFTMLVAAFVAHGDHAWFGPAQPNKEMALAYLVISATLILTGPGKYSVDHHSKWGLGYREKEQPPSNAPSDSPPTN